VQNYNRQNINSREDVYCGHTRRSRR